MGGGEKKKINEMARGQTSTMQDYQKNMVNQANAYRAMGQGQRENLYPKLQSGWEDIYNTDKLNSMFGGDSDFEKRKFVAPQYQKSDYFSQASPYYTNFANTGGINSGAFDPARAGYADFAKTGGLDAQYEGDLNSIIGRLRAFGESGGDIPDISDADKARMRGGGVYDEFAKTGGLSDADRANMRSRATSIIPGVYQRASDEADRTRAIQGGYGPGAAALKSQMLRSSNASASDAALNAELGITDAVNKGRLAGAAGMSGTEQALQALGLNRQDLISRNKLAGMGGAASNLSSLMGMKQAGRQFGVSGQADLERAIQAMTQSGKMFGAQGLMGLGREDQDTLNRQAEGTAGAANQNVSRLDDRDRYLYESGLGQKMAGLGGLTSLYNMGPSGMEQYADRYQSEGMNDTSRNMLPYLQLMAQMNPSFMDRLPSLLGMGASVAGGVGGILGGIGRMRGGR